VRIEIVKPYPLEAHYVTTEDGYILTLFRIPHGLEEPHTTTQEAPVASRRLISGRPARKALRPEAFKSSSSSSSNSSSSNQHKPAVLLQHGLLDSCAGFLLQGHDSALAFLLADAGSPLVVCMCLCV